MNNPLVAVKNLKKNYKSKGKSINVVNDVSFSINSGSTFALVGESGCGKSTLARTMLRLCPNDGGSVVFDCVDLFSLKKNELAGFRRNIQMVFQNPGLSLNPRMNVGNIIGEPLIQHKICSKADLKHHVTDLMEQCGISGDYTDRFPHQFSGGQQQRICIARALAVKPKFIVLDEAVSSLDRVIQLQIIGLLIDLQKKHGLTYLFISHDLYLMRSISHNIGVMYLGMLAEVCETKELFENPLHPYTKALLSYAPAFGEVNNAKNIILNGEIPGAANPPEGCRFHTRCPECREICKTCVPVMREYAPRHYAACHNI